MWIMLRGIFFLFPYKNIHFKPSSPSSFISLKNYNKNTSTRNLYDVLGLKNTSSTRDVKKAYIKLCKEFHPDTKPGDAAQHKKFVELNNAYSILIDKESRLKYDETVKGSTANEFQSGFQYRPPKNSSNPFDKSTKEDDPWYERDYYKREREYFKRQKENAHISFSMQQSWVLWSCLCLVMVGYLLYYAAYRYSKNTLKRVDERSKKIKADYEAAVQRASDKEKLKERWRKRLNQSK